MFLSKSWTGWLESEADFAHVYITARSTVGSHEKSPASIQCRGKTTLFIYLGLGMGLGLVFGVRVWGLG